MNLTPLTPLLYNYRKYYIVTVVTIQFIEKYYIVKRHRRQIYDTFILHVRFCFFPRDFMKTCHGFDASDAVTIQL